jgi:hypothetical protein
MLIRNADGRLQIINRKDCKNETDYNQKLYAVRLEYMQKYKSIVSQETNVKPLKKTSLQL